MTKRFLIVMLAGLFAIQGLQAETRVTRVFTFINVKTDAQGNGIGLVSDKGDWNFSTPLAVSTTGGVNFTLGAGGSVNMTSANGGFYDVKKVKINARVKASDAFTPSVTFGVGDASATLTSTTATDLELTPTDCPLDGGSITIAISGQATVYLNSITVEWSTTGYIDYAVTHIDKTFGDAPFTNALTIKGDGSVGYSSSNLEVATVDAVTGEVTIVGAGEATITATVTDGSVYSYDTKTASYTLNVAPLAPVVNDNTEAEMTLDMDFSSNTEVQTTALTNVVIENILYTLNDQQTTGAEDDGYDSNSGMLVLNTVVTDEDINKATTMQPGTTAYAETFKGLTMMLPQGYGEIEISSFQEEGHALCVKIGDNEPVVLSHEETKTDIIPYAVSEPTYVYVYHTLLTSSDNIRHRGPKTHVSTGLNGMKVHASVIDNAPDQPADYKLFSADELDQIESTADGGIVIDDSEITDLEDDLFVSRIEAGEEITYIDLRNTSIYDMTVDRTKGAFRNVPATTFIYMPAGNSSKSPNVVIGSVCADLQLTDDSEATYQQLFDFMATNATYNHSVSAGESTTLYLPFVVEAAGDGMFFEFGSTKSGGVVCMQAVEQPLEPNTPYVFRAGKEDVTSFTAKSVAVKKADTQRAASQGPVLMGTYEKITIDGNNAGKYYGLKNNRFTRLQPGSSILPFSVYLMIDSTRDTLSLQWSDEASGVGRITTDEMPETGWYTLSGQKLQGRPTVKGLYIHNGQIIVK